MSTRTRSAVLALLIGLLCWSAPMASKAQNDTSAKQTLVIYYPDTISIESGGGGATSYRGIISVKIYPVGLDLVRRYGAGPIAAAEMTARQRQIRQLPLGEYEVHFSQRSGSQLKTYIVRDVILRADRADALTVEMNGDAKTTIIGGDMTAQQMADSIRRMQADITALTQQVTDLRQEIAALKRK